MARKQRRSVEDRSTMAPTRERRQHDGGIVEHEGYADRKLGKKQKFYRAKAECWLDRYAVGTPKRRPMLSEEEYDAGLELRKAWMFLLRGIKWSERDHLPGSGVGDAEGKIGGLQYSERIVRDFYSEGAGLSFEQKLVVIRVCMENEAAGNKDSVQTLRRGLERMARYWERGRPVMRSDALR